MRAVAGPAFQEVADDLQVVAAVAVGGVQRVDEAVVRIGEVVDQPAHGGDLPVMVGRRNRHAIGPRLIHHGADGLRQVVGQRRVLVVHALLIMLHLGERLAQPRRVGRGGDRGKPVINHHPAVAQPLPLADILQVGESRLLGTLPFTAFGVETPGHAEEFIQHGITGHDAVPGHGTVLVNGTILGSGTVSVVFGRIVQRQRGGGRVAVALEHDERFVATQLNGVGEFLVVSAHLIARRVTPDQRRLRVVEVPGQGNQYPAIDLAGIPVGDVPQSRRCARRPIRSLFRAQNPLTPIIEVLDLREPVVGTDGVGVQALRVISRTLRGDRCAVVHRAVRVAQPSGMGRRPELQ